MAWLNSSDVGCSGESGTISPGQFVAEVDRITEAGWNSLLEEFSDASIYQTWAYGAVSWGEKQLSHLVLRRHGAPAAMAQLRIVTVPVLRSGVAYLRWGPVCTPKGSVCDPATWGALVDALIQEYVQRRGLMLRILPFAFHQDPAASALSTLLNHRELVDDRNTRPYRTLLVDLRPSLEAIRANLAHKWRNQLNAAERNGLEVIEGVDTGLYAEFAGIYREMIARKAFPTTVSIAKFQKIQERLPPSQKMLILIGRMNGRPLSGLVASAVGNTGTYLLGATGDDGMKAKGAYLLQWRLMHRLKETGCERYDLGGISEANPGVYHFKKGMGGIEALHLGRYQLCRNRRSRFTVLVGERLKQFAGQLPVLAK